MQDQRGTLSLCYQECRNTPALPFMGLPGLCFQGIEVTLEKWEKRTKFVQNILILEQEEEEEHESQKRKRLSLLLSRMLYFTLLSLPGQYVPPWKKEGIGKSFFAHRRNRRRKGRSRFSLTPQVLLQFLLLLYSSLYRWLPGHCL